MNRGFFCASIALLSLACSSSSSTGGTLTDAGAASSDGAARSDGGVTHPAQAAITVSLAAADAGTCAAAGSTFAIGAPSGTPVRDGDSDQGAPVHVTCRVASAGNVFSVTASAEKDGAGSITLQGALAPSGTSPVAATIVLAGGLGVLQQASCTFAADPTQSPLAVATGRFWGSITCPSAADANQGTTCAVTTEARFENCAEQ